MTSKSLVSWNKRDQIDEKLNKMSNCLNPWYRGIRGINLIKTKRIMATKSKSLVSWNKRDHKNFSIISIVICLNP